MKLRIEAEMTHRDGCRVGRNNYFRVRSSTRLSEEMVAELQDRLGYSPAGYGGPNSIVEKREGEEWVYTWSCWASCD